jgi:nucleoside-diphosphate-sugar epimerase
MKALVTGGGGFLGGAIIRALVARGDSARSYTRSHYPWLEEIGAESTLGDLKDQTTLTQAMQGCDVVFHVAAKAGVWGAESEFVQTNVEGTRTVLKACRDAGVRKLVYTSTPSVVYAGPIENGDETLPYASHFEAAYPRTKAEAEKLVLSANGPSLATVALRPHLLWGPGDPHLIPRVLARARSGNLRRIGNDAVIVDVTYVENAALAHLQAADRLATFAKPPAGRAYFITNGEPVDLYEFLGRVLELAGLPPLRRSLAPWKARLAGRVFERLYRLLRLPGEPPMTRFVAAQLSTSHWFDISAARRDLGYEPTISLAEGLRRLAASWKS